MRGWQSSSDHPPSWSDEESTGTDWRCKHPEDYKNNLSRGLKTQAPGKEPFTPHRYIDKVQRNVYPFRSTQGDRRSCTGTDQSFSSREALSYYPSPLILWCPLYQAGWALLLAFMVAASPHPEPILSSLGTAVRHGPHPVMEPLGLRMFISGGRKIPLVFILVFLSVPSQ